MLQMQWSKLKKNSTAFERSFKILTLFTEMALHYVLNHFNLEICGKQNKSFYLEFSDEKRKRKKDEMESIREWRIGGTRDRMEETLRRGRALS